MTELSGRESDLRRIFSAASEISPGDERDHFIRTECGEDVRLRESVEDLLRVQPTNTDGLLHEAMRKLASIREAFTLDTKIANEQQSQETQAAQPPLAPGFLPNSIGPYFILDILGEGGMGTVYRAQQTEPISREVALKVIKQGMASRETLARFRREQNAMALMDHPSIAQIFDADMTESGQPYFAMELIRGYPIDEYCDQEQLSLSERLQLFSDVCRAVQHAHERGVIHRDLKPSNILVAQLNGQPRVRVIDFGVAKALEQDAHDKTEFTQFAQLIGTPLYMSPEQVSFSPKPIDCRSDVYSLGSLLYRLVTGVTPFDRDTLRQAGFDGMRHIICDIEPLTPSARLRRQVAERSENEKRLSVNDSRAELTFQDRRIDRELDWIIMKSLEKEPTRRYQTAQALDDDVQRFLNHEPVHAVPPSRLYRLSKKAVRHRVFVCSTLAMVLTLVIASAAIVWVQDEADRARRRADKKDQIAQALETRLRQSEQTREQALREAEKRQREQLDTQEANVLKDMLLAFNHRDLGLISRLQLPREPHGGMLGSESPEQSNASPGIRHLLDRIGNPIPVRTFPHPAAVADYSVTPDQSLLFTACADGWLRMWSLATGAIFHEFGPHSGPVTSVALAPDQQRVASGDREGVIRFWEISSREKSFESNPGPSGVESLTWSQNGKWIAAGYRYERVDVLTENGSLHQRIPLSVAAKGNPRFEKLLFDVTNPNVLLVPARNRIAVWNLENRLEVESIQTAPPLDVSVRSMCWAGLRNQWLLAGDRPSSSLLALDSLTHDKLALIPIGSEYAQDIAISPDGDHVAIAFPLGKVAYFGLTNSTASTAPTLVSEFTFNAHAPEKGDVTRAQFLSNQQLLTAGNDGRVQLWNVPRLTPNPADYMEEKRSILHVDSQHYLVLDQSESHVNKAVLSKRSLVNHQAVWQISVFEDASHRATLAQRSTFHLRQSIDVNRQRNLFAISGPDCIEIRSYSDGRRIGKVPLSTRPFPFVSFSKAGNQLITTYLEEDACLWQTQDGWKSSVLQCSFPSHETAFRPIFIGQDGLLITAEHRRDERKRFLQERRIADGALTREWPVSEIGHCCVSHDEKFMAFVDGPFTHIIDRLTGNEVSTIQSPAQSTKIQFSDNDRILLSALRDGSLWAWHVPTQQPLGIVARAKQAVNATIEFELFASPDNRLLLWSVNPNQDAPLVLESFGNRD